MIRRFVQSLKYAGAADLPEYDITRNICVGVNLLSMSVILLNLSSGAIFYFLSNNKFIPIGAYLEAAMVYGIIELNKRRKYSLANLCFFIILSLATFYFSAILGKPSGALLMIFFLLGLIFFLFTQRVMQVVGVCIDLLLLVAIELNDEFQWIPSAHFTSPVQHMVKWLVYAVVISLTLRIFQLYHRNVKLIIQLHTYSKSIKASLSVEEELNNLKNLLFQHIAHDLRGPYVGVSTHCYFLHYKTTNNQRVTAADTEKLLDVVNHYKAMMENFLELSKFKDASLNEIALVPVNLRQEVAQIVELHYHTAKDKGVKVKTHFSDRFPEVILSDQLKVRRIIYNLLSNALKFTAPNSAICILVDQHGAEWRLWVQDQGKGIRSEKINQIFQPYVTEKGPSNPNGVGLGLFITKQLVDIMGASISVKSKPKTGAVFEVTFPMERELEAIQ